MVYIHNAKVVLERGILFDGAILLDGDRIAAVGDRRELEIPADAEMSENLNRGRQVGLYSEGVEVFDYIARRLKGKWVPLRID